MIKYNHRLYYSMIERAKRLEPYFSHTLHHNRYRLSKIGITSEYTFEGKLSCGVMTYCLEPVLRERGYTNIRYMYSRKNYYEDHVHLLVNDKYVVDPTWRQFFSSDIHNNKKLEKFLYQYNPPIYVGTYCQLFSTIGIAISYTNIVHRDDVNGVYDNWRNLKDISSIIKLEQID